MIKGEVGCDGQLPWPTVVRVTTPGTVTRHKAKCTKFRTRAMSALVVHTIFNVQEGDPPGESILTIGTDSNRNSIIEENDEDAKLCCTRLLCLVPPRLIPVERGVMNPKSLYFSGHSTPPTCRRGNHHEKTLHTFQEADSS